MLTVIAILLALVVWLLWDIYRVLKLQTELNIQAMQERRDEAFEASRSRRVPIS